MVVTYQIDIEKLSNGLWQATVWDDANVSDRHMKSDFHDTDEALDWVNLWRAIGTWAPTGPLKGREEWR